MKIIITIIIIWGAVVFFSKDDSWRGYYYPDASDLSSHTESDREFKTLDLCRDWVDSIAVGNNYDYECGLNCKPSKVYGGDVCEKTLQ